jgi:predicted RND superfamily exporter protein
MIPQSQPYIQNFLENRQSLRGLGSSVRVVVENTQGDIFDPDYLAVLKQVNDELFLTEGDRAWMKSCGARRCAGPKSPRKASRAAR